MTDKNTKKKTTAAVALSYELGDRAPIVVASGQNILADKIVQTAKASNVPVYKDEKLVKSLSSIDIGSEIPPELYGVVAEILMYVTDMEKLKEKMGK